MHLPIVLLACLALLPTLLHATALTLTIPPHIPALPPSTTAILTTTGLTLRAPATRRNSFTFALPDHARGEGSVSYQLLIACRDYDFASYGVDVKSDGVVEVYRTGRGGGDLGERVVVGEGPVEVRVVGARDYYEERVGFSPLSLLKNPMILIGGLGLAFVVGMPYIMDSMDPEMRKEFEEQQKKGILGGTAGGNNPLQNFDVASWMAGKTSTGTGQESGDGNSAASKTRRKG